MLKDILKLNGVGGLPKEEQKKVIGGGINVPVSCVCPDGTQYISNSGNCYAEMDRYCLLDS
ncbi:hypothetical protein SY27_13610 [Flavobacterium sp. 316]|uniref:hypothetical protein n=1 Tax=Flavobacterium sp. 316 TaxID=1603293 RepID=UPI0005E2ED4B|nr:hypothetical protein [Flavobacterium sp. 316]KIX20180.1 hypothetical protein SY27_13610 [Flavobacterium sp. 316]